MTGGTVFSEFLDDYFAECDEHLAVMRRALIALTGMVGTVLEDPTPLEDLRRHLHTVKGLSGMVRYREAEEIAHALEDCVKTQLSTDRPLGDAFVAVLRDGLARLEAALMSRRDGLEPEDPTPFVQDLQGRCRGPEGTEAGQSTDMSTRMRQWSVLDRKRLRERQRAGEKLWCFSFVPSPERNQRGIDVNVIRERLSGLGTILKALPRVLPGAGIAFDFYVTTSEEPDRWRSWAEDGLSWKECSELMEAAGLEDRREGALGLTRERSEAPFRSAVVRVDVHRLDELFRSVGTLFTLTHRLQNQVKAFAPVLGTELSRAFGDVTQELSRELRNLRDRITGLRMMPVGDVFDRLQLAALNLAGELGKSIRVHIKGSRTEIDKFVAEKMLDPLLHVVRNAVSHGIEPAQERLAAGKDPVGTVFIEGRSSGDHIEILIGDDGRGIDEAAVRQAARAFGLRADETVEDDDFQELLDILCHPGFSTREEADRASGRGLGLSILRETAASLGGRLSLHNLFGKGCTFTVRLPVTLVVQSLFVVRAGPVSFGVPIGSVREVMQAESKHFSHVPGMVVMPYGDGPLPLLDLRAWAGFGSGFGTATVPVLVVETQGRKVGIVAERVLGLRDLVVHGMKDPLLNLPGLVGAADMGDRRLIFVLDPEGVTAHWLNTESRRA